MSYCQTIFEPLESRLLLSASPADLLGAAPVGSAVALMMSAPSMGDANYDGMVDAADFKVLCSNYGHSGAGWAGGDFNGDGKVDLSDLGMLAGHLASPDFSPISVIHQEAGGAQLVIAGTDAADTITVTQSGLSIVVTAGGQTTTYSGVSQIKVYGFGGNDIIRIANSVTAQTWVFGGDGDDSIYEAGSAASVVEGGNGADLIVTVGGGKDVVYGQAGDDSFWVDSTDTITDTAASETAAGSVHRITSFYQPYTSDQSSANYVSLQVAGQNLSDPVAAYSYQNYANVPLFVDGAQYNDISQGNLGDCYYLASLAALADTDPGTVRQMVAPMGDGTFAVRFFRGGQEVYVRVDGDLPGAGNPAYAHFGADGELWAPLMEKAYAFFRYGQNSYASLSGGWMPTVNSELTNMGSTTLYTTTAVSTIYNTFATNLAAGHAITMGSNSGLTGPIVGSHSYMVKSVQMDAGVMTVTVYNPWGVDGVTYDSNSSDGLLKINMTQLQTYFFAAVICLA